MQSFETEVRRCWLLSVKLDLHAGSANRSASKKRRLENPRIDDLSNKLRRCRRGLRTRARLIGTPLPHAFWRGPALSKNSSNRSARHMASRRVRSHSAPSKHETTGSSKNGRICLKIAFAREYNCSSLDIYPSQGNKREQCFSISKRDSFGFTDQFKNNYR